MEKIAYIDESGDTGYTKKSTRYFILTAVIVDDAFMLRRIAKNVYKHKKDKKGVNMLHAYNESDKVKNRLVEEIEQVKIECVVFTLDKSKIYKKDPYMHLLEKLVKYFKEISINHIVLAKIDTRKSYNNKIKDLFIVNNLKLTLTDPCLEKSLQIADFYSWCIFSYLESDSDEYFNFLKENIVFIR